MTKPILVVATIAFFVLASPIVACDSSGDDSAAAGPHNTTPPPNGTPTSPEGTDGGSSSGDGGSSSGACTGPTFDNTRIPGWPTVPQP